MEIERIQADVLCVGGGIGGLMAAIRASELGAKVVVAEKGNAIHSGKGGSGCDHYLCYIPCDGYDLACSLIYYWNLYFCVTWLHYASFLVVKDSNCI